MIFLLKLKINRNSNPFETKHGQTYKKYILGIKVFAKSTFTLRSCWVYHRKNKKMTEENEGKKVSRGRSKGSQTSLVSSPIIHPQTFGPSIGSGEKETRMSDRTHANGNWRRCAPIWRVFIWQIHSSVHLCGLERFNGALHTGERGKHRIPSANESVHELIDCFEERYLSYLVSKKYRSIISSSLIVRFLTYYKSIIIIFKKKYCNIETNY